MPEYLSPGVYMEEIELGPRPIEGVGTSTAAFLGMTERGSTDVKLVTGFAQFQRLYGGFVDGPYLPFAVDGFFRNGGQRCFVGRIVPDGAKPAKLALGDVTLQAIGEGTWGNRVAVRVDDATAPGAGDTPATSFKLTVAYWSKALPDLDPPPESPPKDERRLLREALESASVPAEVFDNLSTRPDSPNYFVTRVKQASALVAFDVAEGEQPTTPPDKTPSGKLLQALKAGSDGDGALDGSDFLGETTVPRTGLAALEEIDEVNLIHLPDLHLVPAEQRGGVVDAVLAQCENLKDRFAIFEVPRDHPRYADFGSLTIDDPFRPSKYGALYHPWIQVLDPSTDRIKVVPPGGYVAGIYARTDQERGVHKAPANEIVRGATGLDVKITKGDQDVLNPRGVNAIRVFPGRGIRVWGARTMIADALWKYVNVRRLFIFLEESIDEGTQPFVFEPNDERLWDRVRQTVRQFLTGVWRSGALMGTTPEQAFFVKCDRTTMTQDEIDNGRLIVLIGVAPVKPAEFVIFRIAQTRVGADGAAA